MRGKLLWIVTLLVMLVAAALPALAQGPDATVRPDALNMRSGPGSQYSVVVKLSRGAPLTLLARDDVGGNGIWVWARTAEGVEGWVSSDYLDIRSDLDLGTLPVRAAPDSLGETAPAADQSAEQPAAQPASSFPEGTGIPAQTINSVNLRSGPGTSYQILVTLPGGTSVLLQGRDATTTWIFLSTNGQQGWVYYTFLRLLSSDLSALPVTDASGSITAAPAAGQNAPAASNNVPAPVVSGGAASAPLATAGMSRASPIPI